MPYKVVDNKVMHKKGDEWSVKQICSSHEAALAALRLLQGIEHGQITPTDQKAYAKKHGSERKVLSEMYPTHKKK